MKPLLPLIVEPDELEPHLGDENLLIVDLGPQDLFDEAHVPGAIHLDRTQLVSGVELAVGSLPSDAQLSAVLSSKGAWLPQRQGLPRLVGRRGQQPRLADRVSATVRDHNSACPDGHNNRNR